MISSSSWRSASAEYSFAWSFLAVAVGGAIIASLSSALGVLAAR